MTLRITLLILATGLFSLVWIHDQKPAPHANPRELARDPHQSTHHRLAHISSPAGSASLSMGPGDSMPWRSPTAVRLGRTLRGLQLKIRDAARLMLEREIIAMAHRLEGRATQKPPREMPRMKTVSQSTNAVPLPIGIVPGEYRAVSQSGIVKNVAVTLAQLQAPPARREFVARDIYEIEGLGGKWFFIRVRQDDADQVPAIAERQILPFQPAVAEHRRTDPAQKRAGELIVQAGQTLWDGLIHLGKAGPDVARRMKSRLLRPTRIAIEADERKRF